MRRRQTRWCSGRPSTRSASFLIHLHPPPPLPPQADLASHQSEDIFKLLHDKDLFRGFASAERLREAVTEWLAAICADERTHRLVASDPTLEGVRVQAPLPFAKAMITVARSEGWKAEALLGPLLSNIGWLERPGLMLHVRPDEEHGRAAVVQVFVAGDPSMRKSSLKDYTSKGLLSGPNVPEVLRSGDAVSTEATVKGIRTCINNYKRAGIVSDEITTTYSVRARTAPGVHFAEKDKMCTWLNCERDVVTTGTGSVVLEKYPFLHQVFGQLLPVEMVLKPDGVGFTKRFHVVRQGGANPTPNPTHVQAGCPNQPIQRRCRDEPIQFFTCNDAQTSPIKGSLAIVPGLADVPCRMGAESERDEVEGILEGLLRLAGAGDGGRSGGSLF